MIDEPNDPNPSLRVWPWKAVFLLLAAIYAWPVISVAYERVQQVNLKQRQQLIIRHQLWELHPEYAGTPEAWTRFASMLLSDRQLMRRVQKKYGALAEQIEADYQRDRFIAQAEVVLVAGACWALPLALVYGIGAIVGQRRRKPAPREEIEPASVSDSRYRP